MQLEKKNSFPQMTPKNKCRVAHKTNLQLLTNIENDQYMDQRNRKITQYDVSKRLSLPRKLKVPEEEWRVRCVQRKGRVNVGNNERDARQKGEGKRQLAQSKAGKI